MKKVAYLKKGDYFGENALLSIQAKRNATVITEIYT